MISNPWTLMSRHSIALFIQGTVYMMYRCRHMNVKAYQCHDDVIKWKHFPRYWPFVRGIHRSPMNSPHKGQWHGALMFTLICTRINGWVNNCEAGDLRRNRAHYDVIVMVQVENRRQSSTFVWRILTKSHHCGTCVHGITSSWDSIAPPGIILVWARPIRQGVP